MSAERSRLEIIADASSTTRHIEMIQRRVYRVTRMPMLLGHGQRPRRDIALLKVRRSGAATELVANDYIKVKVKSVTNS